LEWSYLMVYDGSDDDNDLPFDPDVEAIVAYLLSLPPKERELRAWHVMMHGVPKDGGC